MDVRTGKIYSMTDEDAEEANELYCGRFISLTEDQLTEKQKETQQVSLHDTKSIMGMSLGKARNKRCHCGSGRKFKKCCLRKVNTNAR